MKRNFWTRQLAFMIVATGLVITTAAWQGQPGNIKRSVTDTVPERNKKIKDIDQAIEELEKGRIEMERSIKDVDWQKIQKDIDASIKNIDMVKIQADIDKAMKQVDMEKIMADVDKAMKAVDMEKIQANIDKAMKEIDMQKINTEMQKGLSQIDAEKIQAEVSKALKEVDMEKIKAEVAASVAKIDMDKIRVELEKVKEVDMKKVQEEMEKIKPGLDKTMAEARESIDKARAELATYKKLIDEMDKDGLIDKEKNYTIEYKKTELTINGKKQPSEVVNKYKNLLKGLKDFTLKKDEDSFNIDND